MREKIKKFSPLTEVMYYILLSLIEPMHGYGVIKNVESMSDGRVVLAAGTLYGALNTLLKNKLIVLIGEDENNKRRKLYQITDDGTQLLKYEIERLSSMVKNGLEVMEAEDENS